LKDRIYALNFQISRPRVQACGVDFIATGKGDLKTFPCGRASLLHYSACICGRVDILEVILSMERHEYEFEIDDYRSAYRPPGLD